jgi:hypothetical protein
VCGLRRGCDAPLRRLGAGRICGDDVLEWLRARSSGVEHYIDTVGVRGSRPLVPTIGFIYAARDCGVFFSSVKSPKLAQVHTKRHVWNGFVLSDRPPDSSVLCSKRQRVFGVFPRKNLILIYMIRIETGS